MARKTAKDYRKEYNDLIKKQKALEARIKKRALEMCEAHPDVEFEYGIKSGELHRYPNLYTNSYINAMDKIEQHNEKKANIKQGKLF